jgi:hypothetical protein
VEGRALLGVVFGGVNVHHLLAVGSATESARKDTSKTRKRKRRGGRKRLLKKKRQHKTGQTR